MYHTSAKLTFGGGGKKYLGYKKLQEAPKIASGCAKKLQGAQEAYKKNRKNSGDLFLFLGDSKNFVLCRGAKNFSRGAPNGKHG